MALIKVTEVDGQVAFKLEDGKRLYPCFCLPIGTLDVTLVTKHVAMTA